MARIRHVELAFYLRFSPNDFVVKRNHSIRRCKLGVQLMNQFFKTLPFWLRHLFPNRDTFRCVRREFLRGATMPFEKSLVQSSVRSRPSGLWASLSNAGPSLKVRAGRHALPRPAP